MTPAELGRGPLATPPPIVRGWGLAVAWDGKHYQAIVRNESEQWRWPWVRGTHAGALCDAWALAWELERGCEPGEIPGMEKRP